MAGGNAAITTTMMTKTTMTLGTSCRKEMWRDSLRVFGSKKKEDREEESVFPRAENLGDFFGLARVTAQQDGDWETAVADVLSALDRGLTVALCGESEDTLATALLVVAADAELEKVAACWQEVIAATSGETSTGR